MYDLIIIGKGPAGLSAAVYAVRAGLSVMVIGRDAGALQKADKIENYLGFTEPISGNRLLDQSLAQVRRLGAEIQEAEATGVSWQEHFLVQTSDNNLSARAVILATGMPRRKASVPGLSDYEGRGVSYCATCDAFFYRGKNVVVIGDGDYAFHEASELKEFAAEITLLTNGREYKGQQQDEAIKLDSRKINNVTGDEAKVQSVNFADGQNLPVDGIFVAEGTASALDLALKLGLENDGKSIIVDKQQQTNLPGVFAAGDCTGGLLQIAVAVGEGALAGVAAASFVKTQKKNENKA